MSEIILSRVDLHCHTNYSDGSMTPLELFKHAKEIGLVGLSITDHDTIDAYVESVHLAKELDLLLIPGIEMSTEFHGESIHVLGYAYRPNSKEMMQACYLHQTRRDARNKKMIERLSARGFHMTYDEVKSLFPHAHAYGRPHIAQYMIKKGYVSDMKEAFKRFLGNNAPCYVPGEKWTTEEAIAIIHKAGGFAVLAHPHLISHLRLVKKILELPFDGLEGYYSRFSEQENNIYISLAKQRALFVTGGSDFHGTVKPHTPLGASTAPQDVVDIFENQMKTHMRESHSLI